MKQSVVLALLLALLGHFANAQETVTCTQLQQYVKVKLLGAFIYDYANGTSEGYYVQYVGPDTALIQKVHKAESILDCTDADLTSLQSVIAKIFAEKRLRHKAEPKKLARIDKLSGYMNDMLSIEPDSANCEKPIFDALNLWAERYINDNSYPGTLLVGRRSRSTVEEVTGKVADALIAEAKPTQLKAKDAPAPRVGNFVYWGIGLGALAAGAIGWGLTRRSSKSNAIPPAPQKSVLAEPTPPTPLPAAPIILDMRTESRKEEVAPAPEQKEATRVIEMFPPAPPAMPETLYLPKPLGDEFLARETPSEGSRFVLDTLTGDFDLIHSEANYLAIRRNFSDILSDKAVLVAEGYGNLNFTKIVTLQTGRVVPEGDAWKVAKKLVVRVE